MNDTENKVRDPRQEERSPDAKKQEEPGEDKAPKKNWDLAPRTGQRHANPFARKPR